MSCKRIFFNPAKERGRYDVKSFLFVLLLSNFTELCEELAVALQLVDTFERGFILKTARNHSKQKEKYNGPTKNN